ncbi:MAG: carboxypeptidase regulatory-like domain-containing protein [Acidobacteria bacterium]|nr:carboxypeptidase regulatory-like domain-containing protein [Acidobacteriota bacterium]
MTIQLTPGTYYYQIEDFGNNNTIPGYVSTVSAVFGGSPLSGTYTVGSGGNYSSLTNSGGIFQDLSLSGATGPVTIQIISDLTNETGASSLGSIAGNPSVLIKPSGGPRTISGSSATSLIRINGADNVRIDGSTAASAVGGTPALRELTIQNLSTSTSSAVIHIGSSTESSNGNTVQNVNVRGNDPSQTFVGIHVGGATVGSAAAFPDNNTRIENCSVQKSRTGIMALGVSPSNMNTGTVITRNDLSATGASRVRDTGILVNNDDGGQISQNSLGGIDSTGVSTDTIGIAAGASALSATTTTTTGGVKNISIERNRISGVSGDTSFSAAGILIAGISGNTNTVANNMISGVISDGTSGDLPAGIFVVGVTGSTTRLYYNSVSMTGDRNLLLTPGTAQYPSYALAISGASPTVELRNNIFATSQFNSNAASNPNAKSYAVGMTAAAFANFNSNYNDFWSTGSSDDGFRTGSLATAAGTNYANLAAWQSAVGGDANSLEGDPLFTNSSTDLHLTSSSALLLDKGTPVSVLDDFDGQNRAALGFAGGIPDIGADEFLTPTAAAVNIGGTVVTAAGSGIRNVVVTLTDTQTGAVRQTATSSFGRYNFSDVEPGRNYLLMVRAKRFAFEQSVRLVSPIDNLAAEDFVAAAEK